jgi:pimeloyl-ACP methyl ester carboxylesterase
MFEFDLYETARAWGLKFDNEVKPKSKHVVIDGFRLHYLDWDNQGKKPMLLLHGGGQTAHTWDLFSLCLSNDYHIYALDQRGHGDSEWSPISDYSDKAHQKDIEGFIEYLKLDNFILIGLSMGGTNAYTYAAKHWTKLTGLVIVDIGPEILIKGKRKIRDFTMSTNRLNSIAKFVDRETKSNPRRPRQMLKHSMSHNLRKLPNGDWTWKTDRRHQKVDGNTVNLKDPVELIKKRWTYIRSIGCPTLIVRGEDTTILSQSVANRMAETIPNSKTVTISKAGHTVIGDNPPEFEARVLEFLQTLPN